MKTRVQKWGNSLAVRIPKSFAAEADLSEHTPIQLSLLRGKVVIEACKPPLPSLHDLLKGITDDNLHGEWDTGRPCGREML